MAYLSIKVLTSLSNNAVSSTLRYMPSFRVTQHIVYSFAFKAGVDICDTTFSKLVILSYIVAS